MSGLDVVATAAPISSESEVEWVELPAELTAGEPLVARLRVRDAWGNWLSDLHGAAAYVERVAQLRRASLAVAEWQQRGPRRAWLKWQSVASHRRAVRGALISLMMRGLRAGLNAWVDLVVQLAVSRRLIQSGVSALVMRHARMAFSSWHQFASERANALLALLEGSTPLPLPALQAPPACVAVSAAGRMSL